MFKIMIENINKFKTLTIDGILTGISLSSISTVLIYLIGGWDIAFQSLCLIIITDYITGIISAIKNKKLNSKAGLWGIIKKLLYFIMVGLAVVLDRTTGSNGTIRSLVIYFFIANEAISILENWALMELPLPKKLFEVFEKIKE